MEGIVTHDEAMSAPGAFRASVAAVYESQGDRMWRALLLYSGDRELASDAVAEAFAQALRRGDEIRDVERWVWAAAYRIAAGELKRLRSTSFERVPESYELGTDLPALSIALASLSSKQRSAVILHHYGGYELSEVAKILGSSRSAIGVHLWRGRRRLRQLLSDTEEFDER